MAEERSIDIDITGAEDVDTVHGEVLVAAEEVKTGVVAAIMDSDELAQFLKVVNVAIKAADEHNARQYVVRSLVIEGHDMRYRFYATGVAPTLTNDLDALYLLNVVPQAGRGPRDQRLFTALRALGGRLEGEGHSVLTETALSESSVQGKAFSDSLTSLDWRSEKGARAHKRRRKQRSKGSDGYT